MPQATATPEAGAVDMNLVKEVVQALKELPAEVLNAVIDTIEQETPADEAKEEATPVSEIKPVGSDGEAAKAMQRLAY